MSQGESSLGIVGKKNPFNRYGIRLPGVQDF
jgi:hypothetical protein